MTKTWTCPRCCREFIVARDAERDVCPWCQATVEEKANGLVQVQPQSAPAPAGRTQPSTPAAQAPAEMWWPYEYDPF